ncbi:MAG: carboxypeptidase regulatory-like domain-containing protein, partial [Actinomycetota bacterium]
LLPGAYDFFAQKPGYTPRHKGNVVVEANEAGVLDFRLEWGDASSGALEVETTDPSGKPLANSVVDVTQLGLLVARSETDSTGTVAFPGLLPGTFRILATRPGFRNPAARNVRVRAGQMATLTLKMKRNTTEVGRLAGVVRNLEGAVVPNARVQIVGGLSDGDVRTTGGGRYEFTKLIPDASYAIQVTAAGYAAQFLGGITVNALELTLQDVLLLPNAPTRGSLTGVVTGPQGGPVPFATLTITPGPALGAQTLAGTDGRFTFTDLEPSPDYGLIAESAGYSVAGRGSIRVTAGVTTVANLQLTTQTTPPGTITGTVRDLNGLSLEDVVVTLLTGPSAGLTTTTDVVGEYRMTGVRPDDAYTVRFTKEGYEPFSQPLVTVQSGLATSLLVQLKPLQVSVGHIIGSVENEAGNPLKNVKVAIYAGASAPLQTTTNENGIYSFRNLRPGAGYSLRAIKENFPNVTRTGIRVNDNLTTRVDFVMRRVSNQGTLSGRVTSLTGTGIANALVLVLEGPELPTPVRADSTGRFVFEGLASGRYTLEAVANGYANGRKTGVIVSAGGNTVVTIQLLRP